MRSLLGGVVLVAALVLAGCGGDGGGSAMPKDEWLDRVNAMCREQIEKWEDVEPPASVEEAVGYFEKLLDDARRYSAEYEELGPPEGDEERYRRALQQDRRALELTEELLEAFEARDGPRLQSLVEELDALTAESSALARELGADDCARSLTSRSLR